MPPRIRPDLPSRSPGAGLPSRRPPSNPPPARRSPGASAGTPGGLPAGSSRQAPPIPTRPPPANLSSINNGTINRFKQTGVAEVGPSSKITPKDFNELGLRGAKKFSESATTRIKSATDFARKNPRITALILGAGSILGYMALTGKSVGDVAKDLGVAVAEVAKVVANEMADVAKGIDEAFGITEMFKKFWWIGAIILVVIIMIVITILALKFM